ncbi:MAG: hypothetical protein QUS07_10135 [Methanothrix sp.]|nr:hypothetical protein [Methanothrix sp.]
MRITPMAIFAGMAAILLLLAGTVDAHRMLLGYKVNELELKAMYDDGTPAQGVEVMVQKDGQMIYNGTTNDKGELLFRPEDDLGALTFISSAAGHRAQLSLNIEQDKTDEEMPLAARVAAGLGYLLGVAGISMIYVARKLGRRAK